MVIMYRRRTGWEKCEGVARNLAIFSMEEVQYGDSAPNAADGHIFMVREI